MSRQFIWTLFAFVMAAATLRTVQGWLVWPLMAFWVAFPIVFWARWRGQGVN